jgi:hypothetical protein
MWDAAFDQQASCIDAEIARARLAEMIEGCDDASILWLSDIIQDAFFHLQVATDEFTALKS